MSTLASFAITFGIILVLTSPLIIVYYIQSKKNRVRHIAVSFKHPQGPVQKAQLKIGFSWTTFFFKKWALLFRGQWMEFFIWIFISIVLSILLYSATADAYDAVYQVYQNNVGWAVWSLGLPSDGFELIWENGNLMNYNDLLDHLSDSDWDEINDWLDNPIGIYSKFVDTDYNSIFFDSMTGWAWTAFSFKILLQTGMTYYFVLFANKLRLKKLYKKGYSFELPENGDVSDLYAYIGEQPKVKDEDLDPGVKQGSTHQYVVPDEVVEEHHEEDYDYSTLTVNDMKLLLKSEGVPFSMDSDKEELLELIEENIAKEQRAKAKQEKEERNKSKYASWTIAQIVEELKKRDLSYSNTMRKDDLILLLENDDKKTP